MLQSAQTVKSGTRVGYTATLWSATSPSLIMNLQWNHWAAFGSLRCSGRWQRGELAGLNLQWRANSNPGTMGRPKSSRILSQVSVPTHPSNPRRAVTLLGSPGTTPIPCLPLLCPSCLLCQSVPPADFTSFPLFLYCLYISLPPREIRTVDKEETKVAGDILFYHHWRYSPVDFFGTRRCQNRPRVSEEEPIPVFLEIPSFDMRWYEMVLIHLLIKWCDFAL